MAISTALDSRIPACVGALFIAWRAGARKIDINIRIVVLGSAEKLNGHVPHDEDGDNRDDGHDGRVGSVFLRHTIVWKEIMRVDQS